MAEPTLMFTRAEYAQRLEKTRAAMAKAGLDALIVTDPSNMNWISGYDGWSFYVHQWLVVPLAADPFWYGRGMDVPGGARTSWLPEAQLLSYPDHYVQTPELHPAELLAKTMVDRGVGRGRIGTEMDNYYYSAAAHAELVKGLPDATLVDATGLVNWQRGVKSDTELDYMRTAGKIVVEMHKRIYDLMQPGLRKNELAAEIYRTSILGAEGKGGDYCAVVPLMPSGADASAPHLTWDDKPLQAGMGTFFEIGGCYRRYHCPMSRTVFLGTPTQAFRDAEQATLEGMEAGLSAAKPGNTCEDIAHAYLAVLKRYGIEKKTRSGYGVGISYPPDWGERTISIRPGDKTELKPGMTFHFMTGLWLADMGYEATDTVVITETGYELLADYPRKLFVK